MSVMTNRIYYWFALLIVFLISQLFLIHYFNTIDLNHDLTSLKIIELYKKFLTKMEKKTVIQNSGLYRIFTLNELDAKYPPSGIALVSQCSSNHVDKIKDLCDNWKGPISIAVLTELNELKFTLLELAKIVYCNKCQNLKLQIVVPAQSKSSVKPIKILVEEYGHNNPISCTMSTLAVKRQNYNRTIPYPINFLRNVARSGSVSDYILVIDIDMIPSLHFQETFINSGLLKQYNEDKIVFVVPVFEIRKNSSVPKNMNELIELVKKKNARPFYFMPCRSCQKLTQYNKWLTSKNTSELKILFDVKWKHPWEPFFVAKANIPSFDERFKQYGMNRVSQICELHVAGYKFYVVNNVFLSHKGFKVVDDFHSTKEQEMRENRKIYKRFKEELNFKYPNSKRKC